MDFLSPNSAVSQAHLTVYSFLRRLSRWLIRRVRQNFPVVGPHTTTCAADCVFDEAGNVIETHEQAGEFKEW
jgi:hypothetical protein